MPTLTVSFANSMTAQTEWVYVGVEVVTFVVVAIIILAILKSIV